ncbi:MAG: hypothetical protein KC766_21265 [Myxococcales bacterium]|nr:hypothetical protein [Myxococcales bacterium]
MLTQAGCLLGEAPEYQSRRQTPPVLLSTRVEPKPERVIRVRTGEQVEFIVPYRSEDAGDTMTAFLYRNFQVGAKSDYLASINVPPSSNLYSDEGDPSQALITYSFANSDIGCNSYTMLLTHSSNIGTAQDALAPKDDDLVVLVTWWAAVVNQSGEPADLLVDECGELSQ